MMLDSSIWLDQPYQENWEREQEARWFPTTEEEREQTEERGGWRKSGIRGT